MKLLLIGDLHYSEFSSIIRKKGVRLANCVNTLNYGERLAERENCDFIIQLGDFFDKSSLNAEELTFLSQIKFANIPHLVLVGNHELGNSSLCSSTKVLGNFPNIQVVSTPSVVKMGKEEIFLLPYTYEDKTNMLEKLLEENNILDKRDNLIIFSHNDLKGVQMGAFISKEGFDIEEIERNCCLFINGHLHNGGEISSKIIDIGNITGQNFSEDAFKYAHNFIILDTDKKELEYIENPESFNFYKLEINEEKNIETLNKLKNHAVLSIKCKEPLIDTLRNKLQELSEKIVEFRIVVEYDSSIDNGESKLSFEGIDHIKEFKEYIIQELGKSEELLEELEKLN